MNKGSFIWLNVEELPTSRLRRATQKVSQRMVAVRFLKPCDIDNRQAL